MKGMKFLYDHKALDEVGEYLVVEFAHPSAGELEYLILEECQLEEEGLIRLSKEEGRGEEWALGVIQEGIWVLEVPVGAEVNVMAQGLLQDKQSKGRLLDEKPGGILQQ